VNSKTIEFPKHPTIEYHCQLFKNEVEKNPFHLHLFIIQVHHYQVGLSLPWFLGGFRREPKSTT
jgi:hypothetical protein